MKAEVKARVATGSYTLQSSAAKYSKHEVSPVCQLCGLDVEDIEHFVLKCPTTNPARSEHLKSIENVCNEVYNDNYSKLVSQNLLLQATLDCTHPDVQSTLSLKPSHTEYIKRISQQLVFALHKMRTKILLQRERERE